MDAETRKRAQDDFGLSYHVNFAAEAERTVGIKGKKVLEVGGNLPAKFCLDVLGANQWISIDDPQYWEELGQNSTYHSPLNEVTSYDTLPNHAVLTGAVESLPPSLHQRFDVVFSIAAFEHIHTLGLALDRMFDALRPGGKLFTMFAPIWSSFDGHHLPEIKDSKGEAVDLVQKGLMPPWCHLTLRPQQLYSHLLSHTTPDIAAKVVYYTYHSPHINRLFTEDYLEYFQKSRFEVERFDLAFPIDGNADRIAKGVEHLKKAYPGRQHFTHQGIRAVLVRPA